MLSSGRAHNTLTLALSALMLLLLAAACATPVSGPVVTTGVAETAPGGEATDAHGGGAIHAEDEYDLPALSPVTLVEGERLRVVATTNILGDVVRNIGGDQIELTTLLPVGADPHSYNATPADLRMLSEAHVIFIVGEGIEESLLPVIENRGGDSALVAVNTGINLMAMDAYEEDEVHEDEPEEAREGDEADHDHGLDPHTWTAVPNVMHWVEIIEHALSELDPANAETYEGAAGAYLAELEALDTEIEAAVAAIPAENRKLVTDHETFGYFAAQYGFEIIGTVIPSFSTLAAPSAQELAALQRQLEAEGVRAIFVGSTVSPTLAQQIANDVGVRVTPLYSDSLSTSDGPAATYIDLMRYNVASILAALE